MERRSAASPRPSPLFAPESGPCATSCPLRSGPVGGCRGGPASDDLHPSLMPSRISRRDEGVTLERFHPNELTVSCLESKYAASRSKQSHRG